MSGLQAMELEGRGDGDKDGSPETDRLALVALFKTTNGESWVDKSRWGTDSPIGSWYGVSVNSHNRVVEIELPRNNLRGTIPKELGNLGNLQNLDVSSNNLEGPIPKELAGITGLKSLWLAFNQLEGTIPKELGNLGNLEHLKVSSNKLEGLIPKELAGITGLKSLWLGGNQLKGTIPKELGNLGNLEGLDVSHNQLTGFPKEVAARFLNLKGFYMSCEQNRWQEPPSAVIEGGLGAINRFYADIERSGSSESWALKVVVVGAVCAGKSSVVESLMAREPRLVREADRTRGVDVHVKTPFKPDASRPVQLVFWDFAGHDAYYSTHSLFLSEGALFLLVVDLARFTKNVPGRSDAIHIWLDTLLCRTPGAVVQVVATHIDELSGSLDNAKRQLQQVVAAHLSAKCVEHERGWKKSEQNPDKKTPPGLRIVDEILAVSCKAGTNLPELGKALATLTTDGTMDLLSAPPRSAFQGAGWGEGKLFRNLGQTIPRVWTRACAVMSAWRDGIDPAKAVRLGQPSPVVNKPVQQMRLRDAEKTWKQVVRASGFSSEIGNGGPNLVLKDAIGLKEREGMLLCEHGLLYLDPTWIDKMMGAILDHRLQKPDTTYWKGKLQKFSDDNDDALEFHELSNTHQTFHATGTLTVSYLHFLWRDVEEMREEGVFERLLQTMCKHGVLFSKVGGLSGFSDESQERGFYERLLKPVIGFLRQSGAPPPVGDVFGVGSREVLFVPVLLGPYPAEEKGVEAFSTTCLRYQWRRKLVFRLYQSYVPPGIIGMIMSRLLCSDEVEIHCTWGRGVSFMIGGGEAIISLNPPTNEGGYAEVEVNVVGPTRSDEVENKVKAVNVIVRDSLKKHFPGLGSDLEGGKGLSLEGEDARMDMMESLKAHFDVRLDLMVEKQDIMGGKLDSIDERLVDVARSIRESLMRVKHLQALDYPYPHLVVIREHQPRLPGNTRVLSKAWFKSIRTRARGLAMKDMRLLFLCPYDSTEMPCGPRGEGYRFGQARDWMKKVLPVAQVTAVIMKVALKSAAGIDLEAFSEYLNAVKAGIGEELASSALSEGALRSVMLGDEAAGADMVTKSRASYDALKNFLDKGEHEQATHPKADYVDFKNQMQQVDDGNSGLVWVSNDNAQLWLDSHRASPSPTPPIP